MFSDLPCVSKLFYNACMSKRYFVADFKNSVGLVDETDFAVVKTERKVTRNDQPYQDLLLRDKSGEVEAKIWSDNLEQMAQHKAGDVVHVEFEVRDYKGSIELTVRKLSLVEEYDRDDFIPVSESVDEERLKNELAKRIDSVRDLHLRQLVDAFFDDEGFYESFTNSPAGMYVHHDYRHGLLQHTIEMLTITDSVLNIYPDMDRDLLTVGVLFHDVGKIRELRVNAAGVTDYTKEGQMVGHIALGVLMLEKRMPEDFPQGMKTKLYHIIVSHQGKRETGSPVLPSSREAFAVYYADLTSTYLNIAHQARVKGLHDKKDGDFSDYSRHLGSTVYLGE